MRLSMAIRTAFRPSAGFSGLFVDKRNTMLSLIQNRQAIMTDEQTLK